MKNRVMLLDPSIANRERIPSNNLGDLIIHDAVARELFPIFGPDSFTRLSTHCVFTREEYVMANRCDFRFVCGTNLLSSKNTKYTWYREVHRWNWLIPKLRRVVLFGVGWGVGYPNWTDWRPHYFYRNNLHRQHLHSVRDSFSAKMLHGQGIRNVVNTSCPTLWNLGGFSSNPERVPDHCVFTLTDYRRVPERDDLLLRTLHRHFPGMLYFFPQGKNDLAYIESLPSFAAVRDRISCLPWDITSYRQFLEEHRHELLYVGTRLHGGVFAMQRGIKSLIISVDHRASEIAKDTSLPILETDFARGIEQWLAGSLRFDPIRLPDAAIKEWRDYWRGIAAQ